MPAVATRKRSMCGTCASRRGTQSRTGWTGTPRSGRPSDQLCRLRTRLTLAITALPDQVAQHRAGKQTADGETEADSAVARVDSAPGLDEWLEDLVEEGARDADAGVPHGDRREVADRLGGHGDASARGRELERVRQQVEEDLARLVDVGLDEEVVRR